MKRLGRVIVVDVESTCWSDGVPPLDEVSEIIEVGACVVDVDTLEVSNKQSYLIKPQHSKVSRFCTKLTSLKQEDLEGGMEFPEVCRLLLHQYDSRKYPWASYGDYDRVQFGRMCKPNLYKDASYPFGPRHINVKTLVGLCLGWAEEVGMRQACAAVGVDLVGRLHRGGDDAYNIARMFVKILSTTQLGLGVRDAG